MKSAFVDIGELGWSLLLSARVRWIKRNTNDSVAVITYPNRKCLYEGMADVILDVPKDFYTKFDIRQQECFGLFEQSPDKLMAFFNPYIPKGYVVPDGFCLSCQPVVNIFKGQLVFEPYKYSRKVEGDGEILIFPRCRLGPGWYTHRNLSKAFYDTLIRELCKKFPKLTIRTAGTNIGAYDINVELPNYVNWVGKDKTLQDMIDLCQVAVVAVGSISALPKISLLQGVPTFMIGHEEKRERHTVIDNWMATKAGFYQTPGVHYDKVDSADCVAKIVNFVRSCV